jgi:hypothetical protein
MSLISLIVVVIVVALVYWMATLLPIPQPFKNIVLVLVILLAILWLLSAAGLISGLNLRV